MVEWFRMEWRVPKKPPIHAMFGPVHRKEIVIRSAQEAYTQWRQNEYARNNPYRNTSIIWLNRTDR